MGPHSHFADAIAHILGIMCMTRCRKMYRFVYCICALYFLVKYIKHTQFCFVKKSTVKLLSELCHPPHFECVCVCLCKDVPEASKD